MICIDQMKRKRQGLPLNTSPKGNVLKGINGKRNIDLDPTRTLSQLPHKSEVHRKLELLIQQNALNNPRYQEPD